MTDKEKQIFDKYGNYNFPTDIKQSGQNIATTQIEEMARVIESVKLYGIDNYGRKISHDSVLELAEELLRHYQPKIPEGSVVMSKEEFDEDYVTKQDRDYWKNKTEILGNKLKQARKETAREIFNKIKIKALTEDMSEDRPQTLYRFTSFDIMKMSREIVEEFGVVFRNGRAIVEVEE